MSIERTALTFGLLGRAHDAGKVNENALGAILEKLVAGGALGLDDLCELFGVDIIHDLIAPRLDDLERRATAITHVTREDLFRAAAIAGRAAATDSVGSVTFRAGEVADEADEIIKCLRGTGVL